MGVVSALWGADDIRGATALRALTTRPKLRDHCKRPLLIHHASSASILAGVTSDPTTRHLRHTSPLAPSKTLPSPRAPIMLTTKHTSRPRKVKRNPDDTWKSMMSDEKSRST